MRGAAPRPAGEGRRPSPDLTPRAGALGNFDAVAFHWEPRHVIQRYPSFFFHCLPCSPKSFMTSSAATMLLAARIASPQSLGNR